MSGIIEFDIEKLCRLCGVAHANLISLFQPVDKSEKILENITQYLPINIDSQDKLPHEICIQCNDMLDKWNTFVLSSIANDYTFRELFEQYEKDECSKNSVSVQTENLIENPESWLQNEVAGIEEPQECTTSKHVQKSQDSFDKSGSRMIKNGTQRQSRFSHLKRQHKQLKTQPDEKCSFCSLSFTTKSLLDGHIVDQHHSTIFKCDICEGFFDRTILISHMLSHTKITEPAPLEPTKPPLDCTTCGKSCSNLRNFYYHLKTHSKLFSCSECSKCFGNQALLIRHRESKHSGGKRSYACRLCDKSFKTASNLSTHEVTHNSEMRFKCKECGKGFKFRGHYNVHLTMHNKVLKFFCKFCDKGFAVRNNLTKHMNTHKNSLDFKCHLCEFATTQKRYLAQHLKNLHQTTRR